MALIKSFEHRSMDRNSIHDRIRHLHDLRARRAKGHPGRQLRSGRAGNARQKEPVRSVGREVGARAVRHPEGCLRLPSTLLTCSNCASKPKTVMAGLDPATHAVVASADGWRVGLHHDESAQRGPLYGRHVRHGSTRLRASRGPLVPGFTKRYGLKRLVYMERYERITDAIQRESNIKHWPWAWKVRLILKSNPGWADLYETLNH